MIENFYIVAKRLNEEIENFLMYEEGGDDVTQEEERMFEELKNCNDYIKEYMKTQKQNNRKFEVGKAYLDKNLDVHVITKITDRSIYINNSRYEKHCSYKENNEKAPRCNLEA